jgi:Tol biopolymer transport system component
VLSSPPMALTPGSRLGPYEIQAPIGAGGMGEVYRARDTRLDRIVAIKVLPEHLSGSPEVRARFEREARAVSSLNHPNICVLYDVGHQDGVDFLVMEHLEGETLADRLLKGPLPVDELLRVATEIADALDKAHRQGLIHRDLKPGNVMLTKSGAKLLDFGLARTTGLAPTLSDLSRSPTMSRSLTAEGTIVGTFQYLAPETLEGREADARGDIFAFGAMLYEMATGKRAFEGKSQASVIAAILERDPAPPSTVQPLIPPALDRLIQQCLVKDPDRRRQTMHDVLLELQWIAEGGSRAGVPAPVAARRRSTARLAWSIAIVAVAAVAVFAAGYLLRRPPKPQPVRFLVDAPAAATAVGSPKISPDGRYLAFDVTDSTGVTRIWLRPMNSLSAQPVPGTENAWRPFWSPDSRYIGFLAGDKLKKVEVSGGPPVTVCETRSAGDGSWSRSGVILFDGALNDSIRSVSAAGGTPSPATRIDRSRKEEGCAWPQFLPDGKHFLFLGLTSNPDSIALKAGELGSLKAKVVAVGNFSRIEWVPPGYLLFVRDRALVAQPFDAGGLKLAGEPFPVIDDVSVGGGGASNAEFSASEDGVLVCRASGASSGSQLTWVDRNGHETGTLGPPADIGAFELSPDGRKVAAAIAAAGATGGDIWVLDVARNLSTRFTFDPADDAWPVWSPDGSKIYFASNRKGFAGYRIFEKAATGVGAAREFYRLPPGDNIGPAGCSRGGLMACLSLGAATRWDVWMVPLNDTTKAAPFLNSQFSEREAAISPDGRWVAYVSNESGQQEVYVQGYPGPSGKWQVSTHGGRDPQWGADGRQLYYLSSEGAMMSVPVEPRPSFQVGMPARLFPASPPSDDPGGRCFAVSADGRRFLILRPTRASSLPATLVVMNWTAALGRK